MSSYQCYVPYRWSSGSLGESRGEIQGDPRPVGGSVRTGDDRLLFVNINVMRYFLFILINLLCTMQNGNAAASLSVAEQYVLAFSNLAKESNTVLLPTNTSDISGMVTQVLPPHFRPGIMHCIFFVCLNVTEMFSRFVLIRSGDDHLQHASKAEAKGSWGRGGRRGEERRAGQPAVIVSIAQGSPNELDKLRRSSLCVIKTLKQRTVSRVHRTSVGARVKNLFPRSHSRIFLWKISLFTNNHLCLFHVKEKNKTRVSVEVESLKAGLGSQKYAI